MTTNSSWYRSIGDTYAKIAADSTYAPAKTANAAEATKYYGIAERFEVLDAITEPAHD